MSRLFPDAPERVPDVATAILCVKAFIKSRRFEDEEHMLRDDLRISIARIEGAFHNLDISCETK